MRSVNYAERADAAQQEQLDWLSQIAEESRAQTLLMQRIAKHTGLIYGLTIFWMSSLAFYLVVQLAG